MIVGKRVMKMFKANHKASRTENFNSVQCAINGNPNPIVTMPHQLPIVLRANKCGPAPGSRLQAVHNYLPFARWSQVQQLPALLPMLTTACSHSLLCLLQWLMPFSNG